NRLIAGEYQGDIVVQSATSQALIPYWYGVPTNQPSNVFFLLSPPTQAKAGSTLVAYVRVIDTIGYAIRDNLSLGIKGTATGGGSVTLSPTVYFPNLREIDFKLGSNPGTNTFTLSFGSMTPTQISITGN